MSKLNFLLMSLVGAIPGGILCVILVLMFLNYAGETEGMFLALAGVTLVPSFTLVLIPIAILVFAPKDEKPETEEDSKADDEEETSEEEDEEDGFGDSISDNFDGDESMVSMAASDVDGGEMFGEDFDTDESMQSMAASGADADDLSEAFTDDDGFDLEPEDDD